MRSDGAIDDLAAGKAGEYLVCADLILKGHIAFPSEQGLPYDVVADIGGKLYRVQVKATREVRPVPQRREHMTGYLFHIGRCGKGGYGNYGADDVDLFALVALDTKTIGYLKAEDTKRTMIFRARQNEGKYYDEVIIARSEKIREQFAAGKTQTLIAKEMGMHPAVVSRVCRRDGEKSWGSPYLDTLSLELAMQGAPANDNKPRVIAA